MNLYSTNDQTINFLNTQNSVESSKSSILLIEYTLQYENSTFIYKFINLVTTNYELNLYTLISFNCAMLNR